jgi:calcineurin-like phosphoesterase family protein
MKEGFITESARPDAVSVKVQSARGNQRFQPLPTPTGNPPYHLRLQDVLSSSEFDEIVNRQRISIDFLGDSGGINNPVPQQLVANALESNAGDCLMHLGDVVYYNGQSEQYYPQFYEPYQHYTHPIFAIPGNHDGQPSRINNEKSLEAFVRNFCATSRHITPDAGDINKSPMIQPNVYWTLETPYAIIIGLYTNVPQGGIVKEDQAEWFKNELINAKNDNDHRAILVCLHHPVFSMDRYHSGSQGMLDLLDSAFESSGVTPDAVLAGHVHDYQRFTRTQSNKKVPYIVAGAGGYFNLHWMQREVYSRQLPFEVPDRDDLVLEKYVDNYHGFMKMEISSDKLIGNYYTVPRPHESWHASLAPTQVDHFEFQLERQ